MHYTTTYQSPLGEILLAADEIGLTGLWFDGEKYYAWNLDAKHEEKELKEVKKIANGTTNKQNTPAEPADNAGNEPAAGQQNAGQSLRGDNK